ncbi:hypothetical protein [Fluviispira vulneris]|uniref:hypothetical protein n=1 Tax=Fluviispira vulneris TaxID=2763012 RepID=UPI0016456B0A|nr:hypothetical protein [Fluviispira vulneris]
MKKSNLKLGLCLLTALFSAQSYANDLEETQKLANYQAEDQYSDDSQDLIVVEGVRASLSKENEKGLDNLNEHNKKITENNAFEIARNNSEKEVILEKEGLKIYNDNANALAQNSLRKPSKSTLGENRVKKNGYRVVINNKTKKVGVLSEKIIVKANNNLKLSSKLKHKDYPQIGYYIVDIPENAKISDVVKEIREENNSSIESIKVEVIENFTKKPL